MIKSKTKISKQTQRKRNPDLVETIMAAKKSNAWLEVAAILSSPIRKKVEKNLSELEGKGTLVVPGKVLSMGEVKGKFKVAALSFSKKAEESLKKAGCHISFIIDEIKSNPNAKDVHILK
ncbi:MAG: uL15 family ribosomal protein [Nanoarchaeota archaeon]